MSKYIKQLYRRYLADRRRAKRYKSILNVSLAAVAVGKSVRVEPITGRTRDMSETGIQMSIPTGSYYQHESIRVGAELRILLALPKGTVDLTGRVVRTESADQDGLEQGHLVTVEIMEMDQNNRAAYKDYLKLLS